MSIEGRLESHAGSCTMAGLRALFCVTSLMSGSVF